MDVAQALVEKGFDIERRRIELKSPIKDLGEHRVPIKLEEAITAEITVQVVKEGEES